MTFRKRSVSPIFQIDAAECGAACLAMVLAFHGRWEPLDRLRAATDVNRDGSKASNVLRAAAEFGLAAQALSRDPGQLHALPLPAILHWNFNHFVVLEAVHRDYALIVDPASGRLRVTHAALDAAFTGVVLTFTPTEDFRAGGKPQSPFRDLITLLVPFRAALTLVALFSLLLVVPGLIVPGLAKLFVDYVLLRQVTEWIIPICLMMIAATLFQVGAMLCQQYYLARVEAALGVAMSNRVMSRVMAQTMHFFVQRHAGEVAGRIGVADNVARLLSGQVATTVFNLIAVTLYGVTMLLFDPAVAMVAFLVPVAGFTLMRVCHVHLRDLNARVAIDQGKLVGRTVALLAGIESIKASTTEQQSFDHWAGQHARLLGATRALFVPNSVLALAPPLFGMIGTIAVIGLGGMRVIEGTMQLGSLLAIQLLMAGFIGPLNGLMGVFERIQQAQGDLARLADTLSEITPQIEAPVPTRHTAPLTGYVELCALRYGYGRTVPPLIEDVSLTLSPGMRVAIVGGSGSGKSTLARLAAGLLEPWSGAVRFDGVLRAAIAPTTLAAGVAYVDQEGFLFEGSVRDNLTLWDQGVPDADLIAALRDAQILADIEARPGRQDCHVDEGGGNFSGGQRQRIEIARALVSNPAILILDEATAALDPITEQRIDRALRHRGCTCIIVAHRLSTIRDADEIIVLDQGRIVERGTHDSLRATGGAYARLIAAEA